MASGATAADTADTFNRSKVQEQWPPRITPPKRNLILGLIAGWSGFLVRLGPVHRGAVLGVHRNRDRRHLAGYLRGWPIEPTSPSRRRSSPPRA